MNEAVAIEKPDLLNKNNNKCYNLIKYKER